MTWATTLALALLLAAAAVRANMADSSPSTTPPALVLIHGLLDNSSDFNQLAAWVSAANPAIEILIPSLLCGAESLVPLDVQVPMFVAAVDPFIVAHADVGVNILCFSQGNLICRAMIQSAPTSWRLVNYIAVAGPQLGQYGITSFLEPYLPAGIVTADAYKFFYTSAGQLISVGNYWNDPLHPSLYIADNQFLPRVNLLPGANVSAARAEAERAAFLRLEHLVLIGGPEDGVITPWQSSQFGFYANGSNSEVVLMADQTVYTEDLFGLQTLDKRGDLAVYTFANVTHMEWRSTFNVFTTAILPWLD